MPLWRRPYVAFALKFGALFVAFGTFSTLAVGHTTQRAAGRWQAHLAYAVLRHVQPGTVLTGNVITTPHGAVSVTDDCTGIAEAGTMTAAMVAYPASYPRRLAGTALVILILLGVNVLRVATLSMALEHSPATFEALHAFAWQGAFLILLLAFWLLWARR